MGRALHHYRMLADGDRILVGLSGGKDSMTLLWMLNERRHRIPIHYNLFPVYIDPGFPGGFADALGAFTQQLGMDLKVEHTDFGVRAHSRENRENPCFLCGWQRRKRMFEIADHLKCNKIALGHNKDDLIETLFLNMCYSGEISTMVPVQPFFKGLFTIIRPLAYTEASLIRRFVKAHALPTFQNPCPSANSSRRKEIRDLLEKLYASNPKIKGNLFHAMHRVNPEYLLKP